MDEKADFGEQTFTLSDAKLASETIQYALDSDSVGKYEVYYCFNSSI